GQANRGRRQIVIRARFKLFLAASAALAVAIPVLAQDQPESLLPPGFDQPSPTPTPSPSPTANATTNAAGGESAVEMVSPDAALAELAQAELPPPIELPDFARRDPSQVGPLPSSQTGFAADSWGRASGKFLSVLMRRTDAPLASRWAH